MIIKIIFFFALILASGFLTLKLFFPRSAAGRLKTFALSYGLGWGIITTQLFIALFWFKLSLGDWLAWLFAGEVLFLAVFYFLVNPFNFKTISNLSSACLKKIIDFKTWPLKEKVLLILIISFIGLTFGNVLTQSLTTWDSLVNWSLKAKAIIKYQGIIFDSAQPSFWTHFSYPNYPWNISLSFAWLGRLLGGFNDVANNLISFGFYLGILALLFDFLKKHSSRAVALLFVFFGASAELLMYHTFASYGDLPLAFMALTAFILLLEAIKRPYRGAWLMTGIFGGLATLAKNEGLFYLLPALPLIWLFVDKSLKKRFWLRLAPFSVGAFLAGGSWWLYKMVNHLSLQNTESGLVWHPEIFKEIFKFYFTIGGYNIFWTILFVVLIFNFKQIKNSRLLAGGWLYLFLAWLSFIFVYTCSKSYVYALNGTVILRNALTYFPIALLLVGLTFDSKLLAGDPEDTEAENQTKTLPSWLSEKVSQSPRLSKNKKLIKFLVVGTIGAAIDFGLLAMLVEVFHWQPLWANMISFSVAVINNFLLNKFWTWRNDDPNYKKQFVKFLITSVLGLGISTLLLWLFLILKLHYLSAKVIVSILVAVWNYSINNWWTFKEKKL